MLNRIMNVYWAVMAVTVLFAILFKNDKKKFVISTAVVHIFVCGFRYDQMHGDLMVYKRNFNSYSNVSWLSQSILKNGKNTLFYAFNKLIADLTNSNFQVLLFAITCISIISISIIIYKYSESPVISYLMWSCFGFYMFGFYSIKQSLAMAFLMFAAIGIFERNRLLFYLMTIISGFIHMPAFVFLPAYEMCSVRKISEIIRFYVIFIGVILLFRNQVIENMSELYYEGGKFASVDSYGVGGKTLMMFALMAVGFFLCNLRNDQFRYTYILLATASLIQMFSVYDNVFSRMSDFYFQFIILYAPFILKQPSTGSEDKPLMNFNMPSRQLLTLGFVFMALLFYYRVNFLHASAVSVDNLVANFKFFWQ